MDIEKKGKTQAELDALYLKLNQSTPQDVINDAPHFQKGLVIKSGEHLTFDGP